MLPIDSWAPSRSAFKHFGLLHFTSRAFQLSLGSWMVTFLPCTTMMLISVVGLYTELRGSLIAVRYLPLALAFTVPVSALIVAAIIRDLDWIVNGPYYISGVATYLLLLAISVLNSYYLFVGARRSLELRKLYHGLQADGEPSDARESPSQDY